MLPLAFWLQHVSTKFFINIVIAGEPRAGVSICTFMQERPLCLLSELRGASVVIIVSQRACLCINIWASSQFRAQTPLSVDKKIKKHYMSLKGRLCDVVFTYMWVSVFFSLDEVFMFAFVLFIFRGERWWWFSGQNKQMHTCLGGNLLLSSVCFVWKLWQAVNVLLPSLSAVYDSNKSCVFALDVVLHYFSIHPVYDSDSLLPIYNRTTVFVPFNIIFFGSFCLWW